MRTPIVQRVAGAVGWSDFLRPSTGYDSARLEAGAYAVCHAHDGNDAVRDPKRRGRFWVCRDWGDGPEPLSDCRGVPLVWRVYQRAYWAAGDADLALIGGGA